MRQSLFASSAIFALSLTAHADTFSTFNISGIFQDGGSFSGTVLLDTTTGHFTNADIETGKQEPIRNLPLRWITNVTLSEGDFFVGFRDEPGSALFQEFAFYLPVTTLVGYNGSTLCSVSLPCGTSGDESNLFINGGFPVVNATYLVASGSITPQTSTAATPEPSTFALFATGLIGVATTLRRRRT